VTLEPGLHPRAAAARRDGSRHVERRRLRKAIRDAGQQRLVLAPAPVFVADARNPFVAAERHAASGCQVRVGVEAVLRPQRVLPHLQRQRRAVLDVDLLPDPEERGLAVDDEAVEVENDGVE